MARERSNRWREASVVSSRGVGLRGEWLAAGLMAAAAWSSGAQPPTPGPPGSPAITIGVEAAVATPQDATTLEDAVRGALAATGPEACEVVHGCQDVTFCLTVVAVPIRTGQRESGLAVAGYVARRLTAHPDWPWPPDEAAPAADAGASPVHIVDAFTASGNVACAGCQAALESLQREVDSARTVAAPTMVDEGDLQVLIGPAGRAFLHEAATTLAIGLRDRHLRPWLASRHAAP